MLKSHTQHRPPSSIQVLAQHSGRAIDDLFWGATATHKHSPAAHQLLQRFCIARLDGTPPTDPPAARTPLLDPAQPLAWQVGRLGAHYSTWVHQPEAVAPPFFHSPFTERLSKTPWCDTSIAAFSATPRLSSAETLTLLHSFTHHPRYMVPCLWLPVTLACLVAARSLPVPLLLAAALGGATLWQLMEYAIHRFVFHREPCGYWGVTLHFLLHGCHHKYPTDALRLVFPPAVGATVALGVYCTLRLVLPRVCTDEFMERISAHVLFDMARSQAVALGVLGGWIAAYVMYDCFHFAMHHGAVAGAYMLHMRAKHMHHHYCEPSRGFGISSNTLDRLFRTMVDARDVVTH